MQKKGEVVFPIDLSGLWMISTVHMVAASNFKEAIGKAIGQLNILDLAEHGIKGCKVRP